MWVSNRALIRNLNFIKPMRITRALDFAVFPHPNCHLQATAVGIGRKWGRTQEQVRKEEGNPEK